jgi:RNA polymerase sigma-70 factor (ECF subfamily)
MALEQERLLVVLLRERTRLLAYIRAIVRDAHLAEDVFQEAFALALRSREEISDEPHLLAWVRRAARFRAINVLRQRQRLVFDEALLDQLEARWSELDQPAADRVDALHHCIEELTPHSRELLRLRYGENIKGQALADQLRRNLNTVYVALSRIHRALAECIRRRLVAGGCAHG